MTRSHGRITRFGGIGILAAVVLMLSVAETNLALAVPANDNFADAIPLTMPTYPEVVATADTTGATTEVGESAPCGMIGATAWYSWTAPAEPPSFVSFDTHGSSFDTVIAVYTGPDLASLTNIGCRDNQSSADTRAAIGFIPAPNTTYYIQVGGFVGQTGSLVVSMGAGHNISVSGSADINSSDGNLTLREAILLARGGTGVTGLNRPLSAGESNFVTGTPFFLIPDLASFDMIHLRHDLANITLTSALPAMNGIGDMASGLGSTSTVLGGGLYNCFPIAGEFNAVEGMRATNCVPGVLISGDDNRVRGSTLSAGSIGVDITAGAANNIVGGSTLAERNVITGNGSGGVRILGAGADGNVVSGNYIGIAADGVTPAGNSNIGVNIGVGAQANTVGGDTAGERNVIASNIGAGVYVDSNLNTIKGNYIGVRADGVTPAANTRGVHIFGANGTQVGGPNTGERNVIAGNQFGDVIIETENADNTTVSGNYIGIGADGSTAVTRPASNGIGVYIAGGGDDTIVGGSVPGAGNVISGYSVGTCACGVNVSPLGGTSTGTVIAGNYIGTDATGLLARPNIEGVMIPGSGVTIGGSTAAERNVISGNTGAGIALVGANNFVKGNYLGLQPDGLTVLGNHTGIAISSAGNTIGGSLAADRNIIAGSTTDGIRITGGVGNNIWGNYIGVASDGATARPNQIGVNVLSGLSLNTSIAMRNVVSGNSAAGIRLFALNNFVLGNLIGVAADGSTPAPNLQGVIILAASGNIIGDTTQGNVISGNTDTGVWVDNANNNTIQANYIGTDATGTAAVPNDVGVYVSASSNLNSIGVSTSVAASNVISGNTSIGVWLDQDSGTNTVKGNLIGLNAAGNAPLGNGIGGVALTNAFGSSGDVGGPAPTDRNVISGNGGYGVFLNGSNNDIVGNYIGTSRNGMSAVPNVDGIVVFKETNNLASNLVSGNSEWGIDFLAFGNGAPTSLLEGNWIGTNAAYFGALGNGSGGIRMAHHPVAPVSLSTSNPNTIAYNGGPGINVDAASIPATAQEIRKQSVHSNAGLGIDLTNGGNGGIAAPYVGGIAGSTVTGFACPNCTVDVYSDSADEGRFWLATATAGALGMWSATVTPIAENITATATLNGGTSEFSAPFVHAEACDGVDNDGDTLIDEGNTNTDGTGAADCIDPDDDNDTLLDTEDTCRTTAEDIDHFEDADGCPDMDNDGDGLCDPALVSPSCTGSDMGRQNWQNPLPAPEDCRGLPEDYDAFHDNDGCPEPDNDYDGYPDAIDTCPGTDYTAGPDGIADSGDEPVDPLLRVTREDYDGILDYDGCHDSPGDDWDGDGLTDENEILVLVTHPQQPDTDGDGFADGSDNCPNWANVAQAAPIWSVPVGDSDCDGFPSTANASGRGRETLLGTDPAKRCATTSTPNDEPDAWPTDNDDNRITQIADVVRMGPSFNKISPDPLYNPRMDINGNGSVTIADVVLFGPFMNKSCA